MTWFFVAIAAWAVFVTVVFETEPMVKLLAILRIRRAVVLTYHDGEERVQFLRTNRKGGKWAHRMGLIGHTNLNDDGTVWPESYVQSWEPFLKQHSWAKEQQRGVTHLEVLLLAVACVVLAALGVLGTGAWAYVVKRW